MGNPVKVVALAGQREGETLEAYVTRLAAERDAAMQERDSAVRQAKEQSERTLRPKVSEKGAIQIVGMRGKFGLTLYLSEFERIVGLLPTLQAFILANAERISTFDADHKPKVGLTPADIASVKAWPVAGK